MRNRSSYLSFWLTQAKRFEKDAHKILATQESASSRVIDLNNSYRILTGLNLQQDDLFRQALTCVEKECYRAAHVMAWAAFMDFLEEKMFEDSGSKINSARPKWLVKTSEDLREEVVEYQIIECAQVLKLCSKSETKALLGLLNKRNECAHPSNFYPGLNESLGYLSEILKRVEHIQNKVL